MSVQRYEVTNPNHRPQERAFTVYEWSDGRTALKPPVGAIYTRRTFGVRTWDVMAETGAEAIARVAAATGIRSGLVATELRAAAGEEAVEEAVTATSSPPCIYPGAR